MTGSQPRRRDVVEQRAHDQPPDDLSTGSTRDARPSTRLPATSWRSPACRPRPWPTTLAAPELATPLPARPIDPPTLALTLSVNDSPLAGREGDRLTSREIRARLLREAEGNVAIRVTESAERDALEVAGRGELQMAVLIETMRREGFELSVSRPRVLFREDPETGRRLEPVEEVVVDVDADHAGAVVEKLGARKAEMTEMRPTGAGRQRLVFLAPSRGLIGYHGEFLADTRGSGVMHRLFHGYAPHKGRLAGRRRGAMISLAQGDAAAYALWGLEERGRLFVRAGRCGLWRHGDRRMRAGRGPGGQPAQDQAAHQFPRRRQGRRHPADAAGGAHAGRRHGLDRR